MSEHTTHPTPDAPTGLFIAVEADGDGSHPAAWRHASHTPAELIGPQRLQDVARRAERYGVNAITLDDGPRSPQPAPGIAARLEAVARAAFLAPQTGAPGLVPTGNLPLGDPFHVSAQLATLDHASRGRAGLFVRPQATRQDAAAYDLPPVEQPDALRRVTSDTLRAIRQLWDSWEDGAAIRDAGSGRFLDRSRLHHIDFSTTQSVHEYTVKGPAITPRPPQGQVPVFATPGDLDPELIDVAVLDGTSLEQIGVQAAAARAEGIPRSVARVGVALDHRGVPATRRIAELDELARTSGPSDRGTAGEDGAVGLVHRGSGPALVRLLEQLAEVVDGVHLIPVVLDADLEEIGETVLPVLRARGVTRAPRPGQTLREQLGLPRPANIFATTTPQPLEVRS